MASGTIKIPSETIYQAFSFSSSGAIEDLVAEIISRMDRTGTFVFNGSWTTHSYGFVAHCVRDNYSGTADIACSGIIDSQDGNAWAFSYRSGASPTTKIMKMDNKWELIENVSPISSGTNSVSIDYTKYCEINVLCTFSAGQCIQANLPINSGDTKRADAGFYYSSTANGGTTLIYVGGSSRLDIYPPLYAGAATTFAEIRVYGLLRQ